MDNKIAALATKAELRAKQDKIIKPKAFESAYFHRKSCFEDWCTQNCLVFQPMYRYFKNIEILKKESAASNNSLALH